MLVDVYARERVKEKIKNSEWGIFYGPDLTSFLNWPDFPTKLLIALYKYKPDELGFEIPDEVKQENVYEQILISADKSTRGIPYHNLGHFQRTLFDARKAIEEIEELAGELFPEAVKQAVYLGVAGHDYNHTGSTYLREHEKSRKYRSVEGRSAHRVENILRKKGYHPLFRATALNIIWASTFGGQKIGIDVQPKSFFGTLMRLVDVLPSNDFSTAVAEHSKLMYGEEPAFPPPDTLDGVIQDRLSFIDHYIIPTLNSFNEATEHLLSDLSPFSEASRNRLREQLDNNTLTARLGWDRRLAEHRKLYEIALRDQKSIERAIISSSLRQVRELNKEDR